MRAWQRRAEARLTALVGERPRVPLNDETTETVDCGDYLRHRVIYDSEPDLSVPAYLLVPKARTQPGPAILAQHGHGPGGTLRADSTCSPSTRSSTRRASAWSG